MAKGRYETYFDRRSGLRFDFKYEPTQLSSLHIFVRHGTNPQDAIDTFFEGKTSWNERHSRFETFSDTHGLYWAWKVQDSVVLVISCFRKDQ